MNETDGDDVGDSMEIEAAVSSWLNDDEFLQKCCMSHKCSVVVLDQIKDHSVFKKLEGKNDRPQTPAVHQLMAFSKLIGMEGSDTNGPNQRNVFELARNVWCFLHASPQNCLFIERPLSFLV